MGNGKMGRHGKICPRRTLHATFADVNGKFVGVVVISVKSAVLKSVVDAAAGTIFF